MLGNQSGNFFLHLIGDHVFLYVGADLIFILDHRTPKELLQPVLPTCPLYRAAHPAVNFGINIIILNFNTINYSLLAQYFLC